MIDIAVFAMRARPFCHQHLYNIVQALEHAQYAFVIVGSANEPINFRNPFTAAEVKQMVRGSLTPMQNDRVYIFEMEDQDSDRTWVTKVQEAVRAEAERLSIADPKISLIGYQKDSSGYYLDLFPKWGSIRTENYGDGASATDIREALYLSVDDPARALGEMDLPKGTEVFLRQWINSPEFWRMQAEHNFNVAEADKFPEHPYNDWHWHECADAVLFQSGAVLLVRRGQMPGKVLWALPGGHRQMERFQETALRELTEETAILELNPDLTMNDLRLAIRDKEVFDDPWRSTRMITTTVAFGMILPGDTQPLVRGSDDAKEARWWNLDEVTREMMFEDHFLILSHFANTLPSVR